MCNDTLWYFYYYNLFRICKDGRTALTMASDKGHIEIAALLSTHVSIKGATIDEEQVSTM